MKISVNIKEIKSATYLDWAWIIYLTVMFAVPSIPMVQTIMPLMLIVATVIYIINNKGTVKKSIIGKYMVWYTILILYVMASKMWQAYEYDTPIFDVEFRLYPVLLCLGVYLDSGKRVEKFIKYYVFAITMMAISAIITSPLGTWGTTQFRGLTGLHRNSIGYYMVFICYAALLWYNKEKKILLFVI